jgi:hypothetical protein
MQPKPARPKAGGQTRRPRKGLVPSLLLAIMFLGAPEAGATEVDPMDPASCSYPLGPAAENGRFSTLDDGDDREFAIVDASFSAATKTQHSVISAWGDLFAIYDGRWRIGDGQNGSQGGSRHNIQVKLFGEKGWNVTPEYASNPDTKNATPIGNALNPRAAFYNDKLWVVFGHESTHNFQTNGSVITLRARSSDGTWGPFVEATVPRDGLINIQPDLLVVGDKMLVAWVSTDGAFNTTDMSLKGAYFDGTAFGPIFNISTPNDGFGEGAFTLATDGTRVAAGYISQNISSPSPSWVPKVAAWEGTGPAREVTLLEEGHSDSYVTSVEFYQGVLYAAYDTNDPTVTFRGDYDVFLRTADPATMAFTPAQALTSPSDSGDDVQPEMERFNGRLYLNWISNDDGLVYGNDLDIVVKSFEGTAWTAPRDVLADEKWPNDAQRAEFTDHQGALILSWIELVKPPGVTTKDQRIALLLLERGARWWDGLNATYKLVGSKPVEGENATFSVVFEAADGAPVASPWFSSRSPSGDWSRLNGTGNNYTLTVPFNATAIRPFAVYACGKPITLLEAEAPPPAPPIPSPGLDPVITLLALAAVAAMVGAGGRRRLRRARR